MSRPGDGIARDRRAVSSVAIGVGALVLLAACGSARPAEPATTTAREESPTEIDGRLDEQRAWYPAPGGLAVVWVGSRTLQGQSGSADMDGTPITDTTTFRIGSVTKPIVAALVLDAVERGLVVLDDPVAAILPGIVRPDPPVTLRMLLDHTSGIFDEGNEGDPLADAAVLTDPALLTEVGELTERYLAGEQVIASDHLLVALAETHERYFAPGEGFHYSNINYQLAALVLERVSGESLAELLRTRIAEPLGLQHTTIAPPTTESPDMRGYGTSAGDGTLVDVTDDLLAFGNGGNGGIISTADELLTILRAVVSGELIDGNLVADMKAPTSQSAMSYGLGLATYRLTCGTFYGHEGSVNGTVSIALISADGATGAVAALNLRSRADPKLAALADDLVCGFIDR